MCPWTTTSSPARSLRISALVGDREGDFVPGHQASRSKSTAPSARDVRGRAAGGPALVVDGDRVEGHVRVRVLDVAVEDGYVAAEPHRADPGLVQQAHQLVLELGHDRIGVARADRPGDRLLGEVHRVVGRAADPDADDPGRARLAAGADDRLEHELLDPLHAVGGDAHLQEAHVLGARALRHALDVQPVPVGDELPVHDRQPVADIRAGVLARDRVDGVRAQRMFQRRALGAGLQRLVDLGRVQREMLADAAGVDGDPGVLADEVVPVVGDLDVLDDRVQHALARDRGLALLRVDERVAQVLRDVLQRPDVEVRGRVLDGLAEVDRDRAHAAFSAAAWPGAPAEDGALEQAVAHHPVAPVGAARDLAAGIEAGQRRLAVLVDHEASVLVVQDGVGEDRLPQRIDPGGTVAAQHVRQRDLGVGLGDARRVEQHRRAAVRASRRRGRPRPRRRSPARPRRGGRAGR